VRGQLSTLLQQRRAIYESIAATTVNTVGRPPEEIADAIAKELVS
jgi:hypothetical protein